MATVLSRICEEISFGHDLSELPLFHVALGVNLLAWQIQQLFLPAGRVVVGLDGVVGPDKASC